MLRNVRDLAAELLNAAAVALQPAPSPEPRRHVRAAGGCWCGRDHGRGDAVPGQLTRAYPAVVLIAADRPDADAWLDRRLVGGETTVRVVELSGGRHPLTAVRGRRFEDWHATDAAAEHPDYPAALAVVLPTVADARAEVLR